jgi:hypothetical protein
MSGLSIKDYSHAYAIQFFEADQEWPDSARIRQLLAAYDISCRRAASEARAALLAERSGWEDVALRKARAAHWQSVADTLGSVLSMELDEGGCEVLLPDPWK